MNFAEQKAQLRNAVLDQRDQLTEANRIEMSLVAADHGADSIDFAPGTMISCFFPIRSEIDPRPLMDHFRARGARLCLPVVHDRTTIIFRELLRDGELVDTGFGTRGPSETAMVVDPEILIMPLSVFDGAGNRIGYGAGHYDRAIERLLHKGIEPLLIGMAFSLQERENVPAEPHDQPLSAIITEQGFRKFQTP